MVNMGLILLPMPKGVAGKRQIAALLFRGSI
jgi:hypothetical protein